MKKLNFALIGCGRIGKRHSEHIVKNGNLVAVCDIEFEKAIEISDKFNTRKYYSIDDLIKNELNLDVVSICTPNGLHKEHTIKSLNAGINVLCEKPLAINVYDCGEMIKAAERNNKRLFVIKQNRFNPPVHKVKSLIDEGRLGKIFSVQLNCFWNRDDNYYQDSWKGTKSLDGGTLYTQFSHFVDLLYWMIGDVREVQAYMGNFNHKNTVEFEDNGVVILEFFNNVIGTIHFTINSYSQNMEGSITIFGEKGTVKIGGQYLNELEYQNIDNMEKIELPLGNAANDYGKYKGSMSNHDMIYKNLVDVLTNSGSINTNSFEGLKTVEIIDRIYRNAKWINYD